MLSRIVLLGIVAGLSIAGAAAAGCPFHWEDLCWQYGVPEAVCR